MLYAEFEAAITAARPCALPEITSELWRAFGAGAINESQTERLSALIEARQAVVGIPISTPDRSGSPRKPVGSRPRTYTSMERRRCWAASGRLPPALAARFTLAEQAVLALVAAETARRGDCRLAVGHVAAVAGVSRTTVKNAIRQARALGLVTVEERKARGFRNLTNVVRIVSAEWQAWNRLARRPYHQGGGVKSVAGTPTRVLELRGKRPSTALHGLPGGQRSTSTEGQTWNRREQQNGQSYAVKV